MAPALDIADQPVPRPREAARGAARQRVPHARQGRRWPRRAKQHGRAADRHPLDEPGGRDALRRPAPGRRGGAQPRRARSKLVIMDEPTAALGVKESGQVLELIRRVRDNGLPVILISHNMPHVFEIADRIHIHRLGRRVAVVDPKEHSMHEVVGDHDRREEPVGGALGAAVAERNLGGAVGRARGCGTSFGVPATARAPALPHVAPHLGRHGGIIVLLAAGAALRGLAEVAIYPGSGSRTRTTTSGWRRPARCRSSGWSATRSSSRRSGGSAAPAR